MTCMAFGFFWVVILTYLWPHMVNPSYRIPGFGQVHIFLATCGLVVSTIIIIRR